MKKDSVETIRKQHFLSYKNAVIEIINNNTNALIYDDILSLIRKPPLDSMDTLKVKLLSLSKKYNTILEISKLDKLLDMYRKTLQSCCEEIKSIRIEYLVNIVDKYDFKSNNIIVIYKKDFININKKIRKMIKDEISKSINSIFDTNLNTVFSKDLDISIKNKIIDEFQKFLSKNFQKQFLESFDIKVLVKDTTLINCIKEQGDRYLFTINNSRLLNDL